MMDRYPILDGGWLQYRPGILADAAGLFRELRDGVPWRQEKGRFGLMPRLTAWYADDGRSYSYSGVTHVGLEWTPPLLEIKTLVESASECTFNSALLNRYRSGQDSMGWHADDEKELGVNPVIASVSFGAVRRFRLKHIVSRETLDFVLADGSLLVMGGTCQHHWQHALPKTKAPVGERINLTFRTIIS